MKHPLEIIAVLIIAIGAVTFILRPHISAPVPTAPKPSAGVTYSCDGGRSIAAAFYTGVADKTVVPGQPPHPTGSVTLNFSALCQLRRVVCILGEGERRPRARGWRGEVVCWMHHTHRSERGRTAYIYQ
jgi:hypothetical protein